MGGPQPYYAKYVGTPMSAAPQLKVNEGFTGPSSFTRSRRRWFVAVEKVRELEGRSCRPAAGAPLLLPGGVCRIVNNPDKTKGKEYVNRQPYSPGAQKRVGGWPAYVRAVPP